MLYEIGDFGMIASPIFVIIGIYMAHTLYKSPRKRWQCVLAWVSINLVCIPPSEILTALLPQVTEQRIGIFLGCSFVLVYLYLFPNIPLPQRIFTYFLVDNSMYLLVLLARIVTMLLVEYLAVDAKRTFAIVYLICAAVFCAVYRRWLRQIILRGLAAFQKNLTSLTIFAVACYLSTVFLVDVWAPWPALTLLGALPYIGVMVINLGGYVLAFRTLSMMNERLQAESKAKMAGLQLGLAEKEYLATMQGIDQVRRMRHDMNHHLSALSALIVKGESGEALEYIANAAALIPQKDFSGGNFITSSFVDHYRELCQQEEIDCTAQIGYDESRVANKAHLGILLGNSLQNAFDAAREAEGNARFIHLEGKQVRDHFILVVTNGFDGPLHPELASTKGEGHGLGLASMRGVVEEYGGYLDAGGANGVFTLKIVLPLLAA